MKARVTLGVGVRLRRAPGSDSSTTRIRLQAKHMVASLVRVGLGLGVAEGVALGHWGIGYWAFVINYWALGIGHWALGIGFRGKARAKGH